MLPSIYANAKIEFRGERRYGVEGYGEGGVG
jgi:hypothetical protein